jgi:hypothetical protein
MLNALYYPHTDVTSLVILKNALVLWDSLETIVPRQGWLPRRIKGDRLLNEAIDLVIRPRVPTPAERAEAHETLKGMISTGFVRTLLTSAPRGWGREREFLIYPEKFLASTWEMLKSDNLARWLVEETDYVVPPVIGFLMMSLLAEAYAGTQIQKVTDRMDAYAWLSQARAQTLGVASAVGVDAAESVRNLDRLVAMSIGVLDVRSIPLRKLVNFRKREVRQGGTHYSIMRRNYLKALQAHLKRIGIEARSLRDVRELEYQFKQELKQDLAELKSEIGEGNIQALFSEKVLVSVLVAAGSLLPSIRGLTGASAGLGLASVIPLVQAAGRMRGIRRKALERHISSWLYLAGRGKL